MDLDRPHHTEHEPAEHEPEAIPNCHWHPSVEARTYCSRCGKHVCPQCIVLAPVGIKCRECGKAAPTPTYDVRPTYYARAIGVGVAVAVGGGLLWALFTAALGDIPFFPTLAAIGIGYGTGELISRAVNNKRGSGLAWVSGGAVLGAFIISWLTNPFAFGALGLLFLGIGVYVAVQRVR